MFQVSSVSVTSLGIAYLLEKHSTSPWFDQEAVALMGLIRFIYLFIYLHVRWEVRRYFKWVASYCCWAHRIVFDRFLCLTSDRFTDVRTITILSRIPKIFEDHDIVFNRDICA
jgi:hypothetical protein